MARRYLYLAILLSLASLAGSLCRHQNRSSDSHRVSLEKLMSRLDPESRLALGLKLEPAGLDVSQVELLPEIPEAAAFELVSRMNDVLATAKGLIKEEQSKAFEIVHGIGPQSAARLAEAIALPIPLPHRKAQSGKQMTKEKKKPKILGKPKKKRSKAKRYYQSYLGKPISRF